MHRWVLSLFLVVVFGTAAAKPTENERFNAWLEKNWEESLFRYPTLATSIGDPRYNGRIVNFTTATWRADDRRFRERQLGQLKRFNRSALSPSERASYDVLKSDLELSLEGDRFPSWMQPVDQIWSFPLFLGQLGGGTSIQPFKTVKDYADWHARMNGAIGILDGMIANLRIGMASGVTQPKPLIEKALPQLAALAVAEPEQSVFWGPIRAFPDSIQAADRERLTAMYRAMIRERIAPAYSRMHDFIRDQYLPKARATTAWSALPNGKAWYAYLVRRNTTTQLTPDQIHALGEREVAAILGETDQVRRAIGFEGDLQTFLLHMHDDPRYYYSDPEQVLAAYGELQERINARLPLLFDIAPKADYVVKPVEAFRAKSAAAASYQNPTEDGSRPGIFYVNTFDLKALPRYRTVTLSLHEASPGHHFQTSIAQEATSLPKFRRFSSFYVAYNEGWALYAEALGKELDLYGDPYQWFGHLDGQQLRAMRLVVDTGLHHKGWTRQQAIDYMRSHSPMPESEVIAEVERYIADPGQALGYKIGQLEITRLRREAEKALGPRFDVKAFHRVVLTSGSLPMSVLGAQVKDWVDSQTAPR